MNEVSLSTEQSPVLPQKAALQPVTKLLYSRKEAAYALSVTIRFLDLAIASSQIAVRKIGKRVLVPASELVRYAKTDHRTPSRQAIN
jgi:hypothetical protein